MSHSTLDNADPGRLLGGKVAIVTGARLGIGAVAAVTWLCSKPAPFVSGATIPIDGGKLAGGA